MKNQRNGREKEQANLGSEKVRSINSDRESHLQSNGTLRMEDVFHQMLGDAIHPTAIGDEDVETSANRKFARFVPIVLAFLNSTIDLDLEGEKYFQTRVYLLQLVSFIGHTHTEEAYQGLTKFLNRLLTENVRMKHTFLTTTVLSLADVSVALGRRDSVPILKSAVPHLQYPGYNLCILAEHFDKLNAAEGIKATLTHHEISEMPEIKDRCRAILQKHWKRTRTHEPNVYGRRLALLQKHDLKFAEEWRAQKAAAETQDKETS